MSIFHRFEEHKQGVQLAPLSSSSYTLNVLYFHFPAEHISMILALEGDGMMIGGEDRFREREFFFRLLLEV